MFAFSTLLRHVGEEKAGSALKAAALEAIGAGERTRDLGGKLGTRAFTETVIRRLAPRLEG